MPNAKQVQVTVQPGDEPVNLSTTKNYLRIDDTNSADDAFITSLIVTARQLAEGFTRRAFITQTLQYDADKFPTKDPYGWWDGVREGALVVQQQRYLELPRPPLQSVTSVVYFDTSDTQQTFASTNYFVDSNAEPGRVVLNQGQTWPASVRNISAVRVTYVAGYGDPLEVPDAIGQAILRQVAAMYENRSEDVTKSRQIPGIGVLHPDVQLMLNPYRIMRL